MMKAEKDKAVIATPYSYNEKIGECSATYAPTKTCPSSCPFLNSGCYGQHGRVRFHLDKINKASADLTVEAIAQKEAEAVLSLSGRLPLRLHVVGDCSNSTTAQIVADACKKYSQKHGQTVWTYTHAWKVVERACWGSVSVLASCETTSDILEAYHRGYAVAVTGKGLVVEGFRFLPCPAEKGKLQCSDCGLCFDAEELYNKKKIVLFTPHGSGQKALQNKLQQLRV